MFYSFSSALNACKWLDSAIYHISFGLSSAETRNKQLSFWTWRARSEAQMPKIKVDINRLQWNFAWVMISIKAFLMQNLSLIALLVLEIWRHNISLERREWVIIFGYLPPANGLTLKKISFYVQNRSSRPKIDPMSI